MTVFRDTWLIFQRSMRLTFRSPAWLIMGMIQPILYLVLLGPLLEASTTAAGTGTSSFNWFIPGLLIQTAIFASAFAGFGLIAELRARRRRTHAGNSDEPVRDAPRPIAP